MFYRSLFVISLLAIVQFSTYDVFLKSPSSGTHKVERLEN